MWYKYKYCDGSLQAESRVCEELTVCPGEAERQLGCLQWSSEGQEQKSPKR